MLDKKLDTQMQILKHEMQEPDSESDEIPQALLSKHFKRSCNLDSQKRWYSSGSLIEFI